MASATSHSLIDITSLAANLTTEIPVATKLKDGNYIARILAENTASTPSFTAKIQHSHNGVNWKDLQAFTNVTGDVEEIFSLDNTNNFVMGFIRAVIVRSTGSGDFKIDLLYDRAA